MLAIHVNYCALKRAMRLTLMATFLIALLGTVEQAAQLCKATRFDGRHDGLLAQDTIKNTAAPNKKPKP